MRSLAKYSWMALVVLLHCAAHGQLPPVTFNWDAQPLAGTGFKAPLELPNGDILAVGTAGLSGGGAAVRCHRSLDGGRTWSYLYEIARDETPGADIGDGHIMMLRNGVILYSYRHNNFSGLPPAQQAYRIKVAQSANNGVSWAPHSTVASNTGLEGTLAGLWSSCLIELTSGTLQCYYDDEYTPGAGGFTNNQWLSMKTWDPAASSWSGRVTVSRAHNAGDLSRDGMCTVLEQDGGRLLCALESVQTTGGHGNVVRYVTSNDGGRNWSWQWQERMVIYSPADHRYNATAPWMARLSGGEILCILTTDEDRATPGESSTGILYQDLKFALSYDNGATWTIPKQTLLPTSEAAGQTWRYALNTPAAGWETPAFNDTAWLQGLGGFGTAGTPEAVVRTTWNTGNIWVRQTFSLAEIPPGILQLRMHHDEDAEVYLNGVNATSVTGYTTVYRNENISAASAGAVHTGDNVIAIHCSQSGGGQYIDAGLECVGNIIDNHHPIYFSGFAELKAPARTNTLLLQYIRNGALVTLRGLVERQSGVGEWMRHETVSHNH